MGYCSISPTCRTVSDSAPLRGRGRQAGRPRARRSGRQSGAESQAGPGREVAEQGPARPGEPSRPVGARVPPRAARKGPRGCHRSRATGPAPLRGPGSGRVPTSLPSPLWELGRKRPLRVRCGPSPPSGFICFPILMSLWIINLGEGEAFLCCCRGCCCGSRPRG